MRSDQTPRSDSSRIPNLKLPTSNSQPQTPSPNSQNRLPDQEPDPGVHIDGVGRHLTNLRIFEAAKDIHITKAYMSTAVCTWMNLLLNQYKRVSARCTRSPPKLPNLITA